jgi:lipopolysaccharide/colanic/teichoic acid biosynthesis glycosyltransferase
VHLGTGLSGIAARRMHTVSLAYEPFLYVECPSLSRLQWFSKRAFDIVVSGVALLLLSPVLAAVALAVKLSDGGPVFFGQERVGRHGKCFRVFKFRSMQVDAERRVQELRDQNERNGPLFKIDHDPRVTRVGNFLRLSSLDELPQLWNVLRGEMSLVGPRPALPSEVALFPPELRARELVTPGISGLCQVEARDNPSFEAYRRLDLFYVENFSLTLDFVIMLATFGQCRSRLWQAVSRRRRVAALAELPMLEAVESANMHDLEASRA